MPITKQQILADEARTGVKNISMRREYNAAQLSAGAKKKKRKPSAYALHTKRCYATMRAGDAELERIDKGTGITQKERKKRLGRNSRKIRTAYQKREPGAYALHTKQCYATMRAGDAELERIDKGARITQEERKKRLGRNSQKIRAAYQR